MNKSWYNDDWTPELARITYEQRKANSESLDTRAAADFLVYVNDYLTVARWASDHGMEYDRAKDWLDRGRRVHNARAEAFKGGAE